MGSSRESRASVVLGLIAALGACDGVPASGPAVRLELGGSAGQERVLDRAGLLALPSLVGFGGILNTAGRITPPSSYRGVSLLALTELVGGLSDEAGLLATASDDYELTFSASQVQGGALVTFDPASGAPTTPADPPTLALAFESEGRPLTEDEGGPLRVVVLTEGAEQVSEGHLWVKSVVRLALVPAEPEWSLRLVGARTESISRSLFESGAAPGCHVASWTDEEGRVWSGIPLWLLVGWVDDQNVHFEGAFDRELAAEGYPIELVARDGGRLTLGSERVGLDDRILLAHRLDGEPLEAAWAPLRLVGEGLEAAERLGQVEEVLVHVP